MTDFYFSDLGSSGGFGNALGFGKCPDPLKEAKARVVSNTNPDILLSQKIYAQFDSGAEAQCGDQDDGSTITHEGTTSSMNLCGGPSSYGGWFAFQLPHETTSRTNKQLGKLSLWSFGTVELFLQNGKGPTKKVYFNEPVGRMPHHILLSVSLGFVPRLALELMLQAKNFGGAAGLTAMTTKALEG